MGDLFQRLRPNERRGSKPRCHLLTDGPADQVAGRLTQLASPFARVTADDGWMPRGFSDLEEAQLHNAPRLIEAHVGKTLLHWWLAADTAITRTPNFDIAATCAIQHKTGLLLVEAKAHEEELSNESAGRRLDATASEDRRANHETIGVAIGSACFGLREDTSLVWRISRDLHYQMSNRFAWSWKLAELGIPVVLVYLGFLRAGEMADRGMPFTDHAHWERIVKAHSEPLLPAEVWERSWTVNGQPFIPLIRSVEQPLSV